jgi:hypothetical protein
MNRIPNDQLKHGYLYKIRGRNSNCGIWYGVFEIARNKFNQESLDRCENPRFTFAYEEVEKAPDFIDDKAKLQYLLAWRNKLGDY